MQRNELSSLKIVHQNLIEEHNTNLFSKQELINQHEKMKITYDGHNNDRE